MKQKSAATEYLMAQIKANAVEAARLQDIRLWCESIWTIRGDQMQAYSMEDYQYLIEPLESEAKELAIMAASGCGKSEVFLAYALCQADWGKRVIYCFESDVKTGLLVQERVNPNIKGSPYLSRRCAEADNIKFKAFNRKGFIYFLGMGTEGVTASYHGDILVLDEEDLMDPKKVSDMKKRLSSSAAVKIRKLGNPNYEGTGIHKSYLEGDQRRWHFTCHHCNKEQILDWETNVDRNRLLVVCLHCHKELDRSRITKSKKRDPEGLGEWKATNPDGKYPSYHIHRLMAPICDLKEIRDDLASDDIAKVKSATRFDKGLPYADKTSGLTNQDLWAAGGNQTWTQLAPGGFMTIDPGGLFDVQIFQKHVPGKVARCCWYGTIKTWRELESLVHTSKVAGGLVDYGPELKKAEEFCEDMGGQGVAFKRVAYRLNSDTSPDFEHDRKDPLLILANRTKCCDGMVSEIRKGKLSYPHRVVRDEDSRFSKHLTSPKRMLIPEPKSGILHPRWIHEQTKPDHQFHCSVYAYIQTKLNIQNDGSEDGVQDWSGF